MWHLLIGDCAVMTNDFHRQGDTALHIAHARMNNSFINSIKSIPESERLMMSVRNQVCSSYDIGNSKQVYNIGGYRNYREFSYCFD